VEEKKRLCAYLQGRVQGVGMRYFVRSAAESLGLTGFVKNLDDGRVEITAEGEPEALNKLLEVIENSGVGHITGIETEWKEPTGDFCGFRIER